MCTITPMALTAPLSPRRNQDIRVRCLRLVMLSLGTARDRGLLSSANADGDGNVTFLDGWPTWTVSGFLIWSLYGQYGELA